MTFLMIEIRSFTSWNCVPSSSTRHKACIFARADASIINFSAREERSRKIYCAHTFNKQFWIDLKFVTNEIAKHSERYFKVYYNKSCLSFLSLKEETYCQRKTKFRGSKLSFLIILSLSLLSSVMPLIIIRHTTQEHPHYLTRISNFIHYYQLILFRDIKKYWLADEKSRETRNNFIRQSRQKKDRDDFSTSSCICLPLISCRIQITRVIA